MRSGIFDFQTVWLHRANTLLDPSEMNRKWQFIYGSWRHSHNSTVWMSKLCIYTINSRVLGMSGRYIHTQSKPSDFMVPRFVRQDELASIIPLLPESDLPRDMEDKLQAMGDHVARHVAQPLIEKMLRFWQSSQATFQKVADRMDNAHNLLAHETTFRYASLTELADELLGERAPKDANGNISAPALFAVHSALLRDDSGFRVQVGGALRSSILYEISSIAEIQNNLRVAEEIHKYRQDILNNTATSGLHSFAQKATKLIDNSRQTRKNTRHSTVGPSEISSPDGKFRNGTVVDKFINNEEIFTLFMESWAALSTITVSSSMNGIGATILRTTDRYKDEILDQRTAWKFLQEIGYIPPWQTVQPYTLRIPRTGRRLGNDVSSSTIGFVSDRLYPIRKTIKNSRICFCIDDPTAMEIDDGVSLESADKEDEYWVHVHIADPASHIDPKSDVAALAESFVGNVYFPEKASFMLNPEFVQSKLSLAPKKPCLTFSAKMNLQGDILETHVAAERLGDVAYITPSLFAKIGKDPSGVSYKSHLVGKRSTDPSPTDRTILQEEDLSPEQIRTLEILHKISRARDKQMETNGGIISSVPNAQVSVSFDGEQAARPAMLNSSRSYHGDPSIQVSVPSETDPDRYNKLMRTSAVARLMLVANEVAARWCQERNLPIPYRKSQSSPEKDAEAYYREKILPIVQANETPNRYDLMQYYSHLGRVRMSTTPGRHAALGIDLIAKTTSPLRRYPDLLVHWQIGAALLHEATTRQSLSGNKTEDLPFLPFTRAEIEAKIPRMDMRERSINNAHKKADRAWICQFLVRAWQFGQAELPKRLKWRCEAWRDSRADTASMSKMGTLTDFASHCKMTVRDGMELGDIQPGDEWEVELENVDVYNLTIFVKAIRKWEDDVVVED